MLQGNNMKKSYTGMRKGLSLMEMLIAIVLFGLITSIGYIYYKNYYDTSYAAKQARVYVIVDQATQLKNAFDLYSIKYGKDANETQTLVDDKLLTAVPITFPTITSGSWDLNHSLNFDNANSDDAAFTMQINGTGITDADKLDYCNILNSLAYADWNTSALRSFSDQNTSQELWFDGNATAGNNQDYFHCSDSGKDGSNVLFVFVTKLR